MEIFNFGKKTINWIKSLQTGSTSKILQNGNFSGQIKLGRGCRQGDPVSPYLFVIAAEIMAEAIRENKHIEGITLHSQEHKTSLYADDTTLLLRPTEDNIRNCMQILKEFEQVSGLKVNKEKTKVAKIGAWRDNGIILCNELNLDWTQEFVSLGISYNISKFSNITELNIEGKIGEIQKLICLWNARNLTPYGKIIIVKSLLISKVIHILLSLPSPSAEMLSTLEQLFRNFIWNKKKPKFRKEIMETLPNLGGLKMTDLKSFDHALKISWIKRLVNQEKGWAEFPMKHGLNEILRYRDQYPKQILGTITKKFWRDVVLSIIKFNDCTNWKKNFIPYMPLWHNTLNNIEYRKDWECKGYHIVDDIISNNGIIYTENELKDRGLKSTF